jgi:hypothetical protein
MKNPPDSNKSRIPYSEGSLPRKHNFLKFKQENAIKIKNKPDPAPLRPSNLSNEIKKWVPKSRKTIPYSASYSSDIIKRNELDYSLISCSFDKLRVVEYRLVRQIAEHNI